MESIPSLSQALEILFFEDAPRLAKEQQIIKRHRCFSASSLLLVLGSRHFFLSESPLSLVGWLLPLSRCSIKKPVLVPPEGK